MKEKPRLGLFSKGVSSAQMTKGVPDLAFREYSFLSRKPSTSRTAVFAPVGESDLKSKYRQVAEDDDDDDAHSAASLAKRRKSKAKEHASKAIASKPVSRQRQTSALVSSNASGSPRSKPRTATTEPVISAAADQPKHSPLRSVDAPLNIPAFETSRADLSPHERSRSKPVNAEQIDLQRNDVLSPQLVQTASDVRKSVPFCQTDLAHHSIRQSTSQIDQFEQPTRPLSESHHQRISSNEVPLDQINMTGWSQLQTSDEQEVAMDWLYASDEEGEEEVLFNQPVRHTEAWLEEVESPLPDEYYLEEDDEGQEQAGDIGGHAVDQYAGDVKEGDRYALEGENQVMDFVASQQEESAPDEEEKHDEMAHFWWKPRRR